MINIIQQDHPTLREIAETVPPDDIQNQRITTIISDMKEALASQADGVAIAAPQIGESVRIFIVAGHVFALQKDENPKEHMYHDLICINPRIIKRSQRTELLEEGCLSVRWKYGYVERSLQATIEAYGEEGKRFTRGATGLLAHIFQHEIDHLDGILFTDKARDIREAPPAEDNSAEI